MKEELFYCVNCGDLIYKTIPENVRRFQSVVVTTNRVETIKPYFDKGQGKTYCKECLKKMGSSK